MAICAAPEQPSHASPRRWLIGALAVLGGGLSAFSSASPTLAPTMTRAMGSTWSARAAVVPAAPGEAPSARAEAPRGRSVEQPRGPLEVLSPQRPAADARPARTVVEPSSLLRRRSLPAPPIVVPAARAPNWIESHLSPPAYDRAAARVDAGPPCDRRDPSCNLDAWGVDSPSGRLPPAAMMYAAGALASEVVPPIGAPSARTGAVQFSPGAVTFRKDF